MERRETEKTDILEIVENPRSKTKNRVMHFCSNIRNKASELKRILDAREDLDGHTKERLLGLITNIETQTSEDRKEFLKYYYLPFEWEQIKKTEAICSIERGVSQIKEIHRLLKRKDNSKDIEIYSIEQDIDQFEKRFSDVLHSGDILHLYEENIIISMMKPIKQHPEIKHEFINMLRRDIPKYHPSFPDNALYRAHVQTARAFQYARNYILYLAILHDPSPYLDGTEIHVGIAYATMDEQNDQKDGILEDPDSLLFLRTKDRDHLRQSITKIDAGCASPKETWTDDVRRQIKKTLNTEQWKREPPEAWQEPPKDLPQTGSGQQETDREESAMTLPASERTSQIDLPTLTNQPSVDHNSQTEKHILYLSSLQLSYKEQLVQSLEVMYYYRKGTKYLTSKLETKGGTYYTPEINKEQQDTDTGFRVREQIRPFLSGIEYEIDTTLQEKDTKKLESGFWEGVDGNWRLSNSRLD
jgi:hypothetical protein